jgi:hypothetical protein
MSVIPLALGGGGSILKSVAQLVVNSLNDGQAYENLTNFTVYLEQSTGIRGAKHVEITNISFSNYVKQFHSLKNKFAFLYNGSPSSITIDDGVYYDVSGIVSEMNTKFTAGGFTIQVAYDTNSKKLQFTEGGGNTVQFLGGFADAYAISNRCNAKLGYYSGGAPFASSAQFAQLPLRLNPECIYLGSSLSSDAVSPTQPTIKNVMVKIPLYTYTIGDLISYIPSADLVYDLKTTSIDSIRFNIYDEDLLLTNDVMQSPMFIEMHFSD